MITGNRQFEVKLTVWPRAVVFFENMGAYKTVLRKFYEW